MTKNETNLTANAADHLRQGGCCEALDLAGVTVTGRGLGWTFGTRAGIVLAWTVDADGAYGCEITAEDLAECEE